MFFLDHLQIILLSLLLVLLILLSAFFSASETGLMAINRYRLRHEARQKKRISMLILKLLKRPDRLLGMILIGNNCANIIASAIATLMAVSIFGEKAVIVSTVLLTLVVLVFAEVAPKTLAALYPARVSKLIAWPVYYLLILFYPVVWLLNTISNGLLKLFGVKFNRDSTETLSREELRTIVYETAGRLPGHYQNMLLGILDLNKITVDDVMVPRHEVAGIDLEEDIEEIQNKLASSHYDWLPVYRENINQTQGFLHLRELMHHTLRDQAVTKSKLLSLLHEPYFIPEGTSLNVQLGNFQRQHRRIALVVDEYGEILGLVTLEDILEEIVGKFTTTVSSTFKLLEEQPDGSVLADGAVMIRSLNRFKQWQLPIKGARTLNGLIVEHLEAIPRADICIKIAGYPIEILEVEENRIKLARIYPSISPH